MSTFPSRGMHFNFLLSDEGVGGSQAGGVGGLPRTNREDITKIHLFEFRVQYLNFGATYLSLALYI